MKIRYDKEADAAYIYLVDSIKDGEVKKTISLNDNIAVDLDAGEKIIGMEILSASKMLNKKLLLEAQAA